MTITLFMAFMTVGATVTSLLTEAIKTMCENAGKKCSPNAIALINAVVVGIGGTAIAYTLLGVEWTFNNILCMILVSFCTWVGSMVGYDKIIQLISQIGGK